MDLIDRYIYAVTERLPDNVKADVSRELHANIIDMLPENPTDDDIRAVLIKLGNPSKLSNEYNPSTRYLIGPGLYDTYISVLKLVTCIVVIVFGFTSSIVEIARSSAETDLPSIALKILINTIKACANGAVASLLWVTAVFFILEKTGISEGELPFKKNRWSPEDLPMIPAAENQRISRPETVTSLCFSLLFTVLSLVAYLKPQIISLYRNTADGLTQVTPVFLGDRLKLYMVVLLLFTAVELGILIWKFISMRWNPGLATVNTIRNIAICIFMYVAATDDLLINPRFYEEFAGQLDLSVTTAKNGLQTGSLAFFIIFTLVSIGDSINGFIKCRKQPSV